MILEDGVYKTQLYVANSGTADAWITFQADECATPIIEGPGVGPTEDNQDSGISSTTATYVKFIGIVSRGWSTGFGNGWTGNVAQDSNGNWEISDCIADQNGRTGFTFFSANGMKLKNSIAAHNGSSTMRTLGRAASHSLRFAEQGTSNLVDTNVSFENMDNLTWRRPRTPRSTPDGSGFIVDQSSHAATFVNNIAFRNGGSCLRLTLSKNTTFVNNTCYHDAQDTADDAAPPNPGELYFTAPWSGQNRTDDHGRHDFANNVLVASGHRPRAATPVAYNQAGCRAGRTTS